MVQSETENLRLNLGAREQPIPGFKGMDLDPHPGIDFVGDVSDLSRFADGSVEEIYGSHVLEHFEHHKTDAVLKEWFRVLRPGGKLYVAVPDFARAVEIYHALGLEDWVIRFCCGDQGYPTAYHYSLFDEERLGHLLKKAGFSDAFRVEQFPIGNDGDCSNMASTHDGLPVSLNMIAVKGA